MQNKSNIDLLPFEHSMSAHCENGVTGNLLRFHNINLSEAMIFGLGSGLFFSYLPFIKMNGAPVTSFRPLPGLIFKRVTKYLGIRSKSMRFPRQERKSMQKLDDQLSKGIPTAMVVGVYHLTYFPAPYRFHFNAHNIIAFGKKDNKYVVSDPIMETEEWISYDDLRRVRYAKGAYKPKGKMYWIESSPKEVDINKAIVKSIKRTAEQMAIWPGPIIGTRGMKLLAKDIKKWERKYESKKAAKYLGSVVRMQEEIGTGGAGFRFLYAAFLQEAAEKLNSSELRMAAIELTLIGDLWREFATKAARVCKARTQEGETYHSVSDLLVKIADKENLFFRNLLKTIKAL
ncbi:MAG: BtrH N-terminal domain-containing protein [Bacteroidales bacterium]|nr:BtrH N-terminal domain-containing protein [Bacteroidales bacterium]